MSATLISANITNCSTNQLTRCNSRDSDIGCNTSARICKREVTLYNFDEFNMLELRSLHINNFNYYTEVY